MATQQATGVNAVLRDIRISLSELFTGGGRLEPKEELLVEVLFGLLGVMAFLISMVLQNNRKRAAAAGSAPPSPGDHRRLDD